MAPFLYSIWRRATRSMNAALGVRRPLVVARNYPALLHLSFQGLCHARHHLRETLTRQLVFRIGVQAMDHIVRMSVTNSVAEPIASCAELVAHFTILSVNGSFCAISYASAIVSASSISCPDGNVSPAPPNMITRTYSHFPVSSLCQRIQPTLFDKDARTCFGVPEGKNAARRVARVL
jgi:hypothetical protein